ncbi:uncharacterized protein si:ch1073-126c3.2 [Heterodontus francisci]|uniref:uncharacterized protein si:ch1073-126c3.2 n=1 Tax=Heterodontus francisci TaxID=7792 RepID=UPI00355B22DF
MDRTLLTVFALIGVSWTLIPGIYLIEETETCQTVFDTDSYLNFSSNLKDLASCSDHLIEHLEGEKRSNLLGLLQNAADRLKSVLLKACQNVNPKNCSLPLIPANGGLICITVDKTRYCKPLCNKGYDFAFLRISRLYEECGENTNYRWDTQYIGGRRLAVCTASSRRVSGMPSAYFPERCHDVLYNYTQEKIMISTFKDELKKTIIGKFNKKNMCLLCGDSS